MAIVFACPRCRFVMKAPEDKGGLKIKCQQCDIQLEIPFLRGILVDVPAEQAAPVVFGVSTPKPGSGPGLYQPRPGSSSGVSTPRHGSSTGTVPAPTGPRELRADEWLKDAAERKDADDLEGAIRMLQRAYEEIKRENALYHVDTFLRLPAYLHQAGKTRESWQEFNNLLFQGYPNQPRDMVRLPLDRAKILDKMRQFLEREGNGPVSAVYNVFSQVCEGVGLWRDEKKRDVRSRFSKATCQELINELKKYSGNLGQLQDVRTIIVDELNHWPDLNFDRLGDRLDAAFGK